jgi:hypothetical protein
MGFSFCQSLPAYFILFFSFLTQCFGGCALDKMRKNKESNNIPTSQVKKASPYLPLSVMIHIKLAGTWGCLLKFRFIFYLILILINYLINIIICNEPL